MFACRAFALRRVAHLRTFRLPGGEKAVKRAETIGCRSTVRAAWAIGSLHRSEVAHASGLHPRKRSACGPR